MTEGTQPQRQWVSLPHGSCDVRVGSGAVGLAAQVLRSTTSVRTRCLLLAEGGVDGDLVEELRRNLVDGGNDVTSFDLVSAPDGFDAARELFDALGQARITSDDLLVAVGGVRLLSLASFAAASWCGGVRLVLVPTDEDGALEAVVTPRWLASGDTPETVAVEPVAKHALLDLDRMEVGLQSEPSLLARALMVATAVAESEKSFSKLWDLAEEIMSGSPSVLTTALCDALKSRGHLASSTSLAIRQSTTYGLDLVRALRACLPGEPDSTLLAEALRLSARISAGMGKLPVDDVFAQDDLLETLGLPELTADVDPGHLVDAICEERFLRSRRLMLVVPQQLGRVRLTAVDEALLREHITAWCNAHRA